MSSSRLSAIVAWFCAWPGRFADRHPAPPNLRGQRLTLVPMVLVVSTSCMLACIGLRVAQPDPGDKEIMVETTRNIWQLAFPSSLLSFILSIYLTVHRSSPAVCKSLCYHAMNACSYLSAVLWYAGFCIFRYRPGAYWAMAMNFSPIILGLILWCLVLGSQQRAARMDGRLPVRHKWLGIQKFPGLDPLKYPLRGLSDEFDFSAVLGTSTVFLHRDGKPTQLIPARVGGLYKKSRTKIQA